MPPIPDHVTNIRSNLAEITRLLDVHRQLTGTGPGRRRDVQVLNKSSVLLLVATWEAYVEDLAISACRFIVEHATSFKDMPERALVKTSRRLTTEKHDNSIWKLSGDGWKNELLAQVEIEASRLNSPDAPNVDQLFQNSIGLKNLTKNFYWTGASHESVIKRLGSLIEMRGEIAHRVEASNSVTKGYVENNVNFVMRLGAISSNRVRNHIYGLVHVYPWPSFRHRTTS